MPGYRVHLIGGGVVASILLGACFTAGCIAGFQDLPFIACLCIAALAGSLFPDIDVKSKGQNYFYWAIFLLLLYYYSTHRFDRCAGIALVAVFPLLTKHRGILHNVWFLLALIGACMMHAHVYCKEHAETICIILSFFFAGMLSHLWLDLGLRRMLRLPWRW